MRITGGKYRGRKIVCPPGIIRPAMDRMRESLFAILGNLNGLSFLDLFTGSGVIGIEAASRGAAPVVLVEKDFKKKTVIRQNLEFVQEDIRLCLMPAERFVQSCREKFDFVFLDPPFNYKYKQDLLERVQNAAILKPDGLCLLHRPQEDKIPEQVKDLCLSDRRQYGRSVLMFFRLHE